MGNEPLTSAQERAFIRLDIEVGVFGKPRGIGLARAFVAIPLRSGAGASPSRLMEPAIIASVAFITSISTSLSVVFGLMLKIRPTALVKVFHSENGAAWKRISRNSA